ncbi:hypothetical protein I317_05078 [Kwoniella heveanensis CBS 569]|uniref:Cyclase n=1 Tax=Kwoniella heveanensis BCC8398 TaxID=1296120 RepID=A0A1B9GXW8_9TREE|nr:hypothetical protein I316_02349 [Kwoniella heveanensis BCC8398]OCF41067.1 hypothetical protein I317_05078 [Kwoniella heveanensis CBS 569]
MSLPCTFDELKSRPGPPLNAWGLYGPDDELGRLNLITPDAVKRASQAVKQGICINLNLPLSSFPSLAPSVRPKIKHEVHHRVYCIDDVVTFNTQTSTQWDGFRHFPYKHYPKQDQYTYHGGMTEEEAKDPSVTKYGVQNYARKPISSRAHLLDVASYVKRHGLPPLSYFDTSTPIDLETLVGCAEESGVYFALGDICIIRTGWTEAFLSLTEEERAAVLEKRGGTVGVDQGEDMLRWHWEQGISAVVSDTGAYEVYPSPKSPSIHEVFLAGWGLPMGELFDLRELAATCEKYKQWTFMFTSMGLNLDGGIATPPNAQAIL